MRRWLMLLPLALLVATWFALRPGVTAAVAPTALPVAAAAQNPVLVAVGGAGLALTESGAVAGEREALAPDPEADQAPLPQPSAVDASSPTAILTVRAFLPDGRPWKDGRIQITARSSPLQTVRINAKGRANIGVRWQIRSGGRQSVFSVTDDQGTLEVHSVVPDLPLELRAIDLVGAVVTRASGIVLNPGEQRTIELWAVRFPWPLRGRCVDEVGRPLAGVIVEIDNARPEFDAVALGWSITTDETGEFVTPPLFAEQVHVRAVLADRIAAERRDVSADGAVLELVLRRGRPLLVETLDDSGERVEGAWFGLHEPGADEPLGIPSEPCAEGRLFTALPDRPLELRWGGPCTRASLAIATGVERVQVRVQRPGKLAIEVGALPGGLEAIYGAGVYCADGTTSVAPPKSVLNTGRQQALWTLAPGSYRLQLLHWPPSAPATWVPWGAPVEVEVRAGETTFERLGG